MATFRDKVARFEGTLRGLYGIVMVLVCITSGWAASVSEILDPEQGLGVLQKKVAEPERLFLRGLQAVLDGKIDEAIREFKELIRLKPDFRLAQLIYGDLLMAKGGVVREFGQVPAVPRERIEELLHEARTRAHALLNVKPDEAYPGALIHFSRRESHAVLVDLEASRLYLYRNRDGIPELTFNFYVSTGRNGSEKRTQGDKRTPIGLYFITDLVPGKKLPDFYGAGALPINYPNEWDRRQGHSGFGIWLHGSPLDTYSRPPRASEGCVALTNRDFRTLERNAGIGTPVVISSGVQWTSQWQWRVEQERFLKLLEGWFADWQSRDTERILRHYSEQFSNFRLSFRDWRSHLKETLDKWPGGAFREEEISIFRYPGTDMVVVTFPQEQKGRFQGNRLLRRQYWRLEGADTWRIVYEDTG
ncbi:MAG: L,D-transpeptidase [Magnetococcales bacterium]|nr:L,D-transpeptidase [Magnetococcales bacterium]